VRVLPTPVVTRTAPSGTDEVFGWMQVVGSGSWEKYEYTFESSSELDIGGFFYFVDWEAQIVFSCEVTLGEGEEFTTGTFDFTIPSKGTSPPELRLYAQKKVPADYPFADATGDPGIEPEEMTLTTAYASLAANSSTGAKSLNIQPLLKELMQAGHFMAGVPTRVTFVLRPTAYTDSYRILRSSLAANFTARVVSPGEVERVAGGTGYLITSMAFRPDLDAWSNLYPRIRNSGNSNIYGTDYWWLNPSLGTDKKFIFNPSDPYFFTATNSINELDTDTFAPGMQSVSGQKVRRMFGNNRDWNGGAQPGWGMRPDSKSYLIVGVFREPAPGETTQWLIDTFNTIGYALEVEPRNGGFDGYVRLSQDFMTDFGVQEVTLTSPPSTTENDVVTVALWWNHATSQITLWSATSTSPNGVSQTWSYTNGPEVDGVTGEPGSWTASGSPNGMLGWQWRTGRYAFTGAIEFASGIPSDIVDAVRWMHRYVPQGVKGWYPGWRP
jgi:hypothetical protein